ncbi:MAG TPA: metallophosphoesterase, partial [Myxococcota bacterium]
TAQCPDDVACKILLAHRPEALDASSQHGYAVQLSGHTHGGQMALFGRSLVEGLVPMKYLLGHYEKDGTSLFTTAGLGHWFPFRLNCPTEAALVTLRSA